MGVDLRRRQSDLSQVGPRIGVGPVVRIEHRTLCRYVQSFVQSPNGELGGRLDEAHLGRQRRRVSEVDGQPDRGADRCLFDAVEQIEQSLQLVVDEPTVPRSVPRSAGHPQASHPDAGRLSMEAKTLCPLCGTAVTVSDLDHGDDPCLVVDSVDHPIGPPPSAVAVVQRGAESFPHAIRVVEERAGDELVGRECDRLGKLFGQLTTYGRGGDQSVSALDRQSMRPLGASSSSGHGLG